MIAVTGSNGYIGKVFVESLLGAGHEVLHLTRSMHKGYKYWQHFDLTESNSVIFPSDVNVVVHLAFNPNAKNENDSFREIEAARCLVVAAKDVGAKVIFISSQAARFDSPTLYGRTKWAIERLVLDSHGVVVRPGQVYGGEELGLFGLLVDTVARLPVLPSFQPSPLVQPVHIDDLSNALLQIIDQEDMHDRIFCIAQSEPVEFTSFLKSIAINRLHVRRLFIPIPVSLVNIGSILLGERVSCSLGFSRLKSLFELPAMESVESLKSLGLTLRPLHKGMPKNTDSLDFLQQEASAILCYLLKESPPQELVNRYIEAIEYCRSGHPLGLPRFMLQHPVLLALIDDRSFLMSDRGAEFAWRLDAATLLAEATPRGSTHFIGINSSRGAIRYAINIVYVLFMEVFWRLARILAMPLFLRQAILRYFP